MKKDKLEKVIVRRGFLVKIFLLFLIITFLMFVWLRGGLDKVYLDSDFARDLSEISKLCIGKNIIWLGPRFSVGLHSSPFYYYLFYIPVFLSGGSAYSLIVFNVFLALLTLFVLGYFSLKKYGHKGLLVPLVLGLTPWCQDIALHTGNGFTYAIFLMGSLIAFWFNLPIILAAFFLGISVSMHPGAVWGVLIFIYAVIKNKTPRKKIILSILVFTLPFLPLLIFEIITKGYWFKQWLLHPEHGLNIALDWINLKHFFVLSGINLYFGLVFLLLFIFLFKGKEKVWLIIGTLGFLFFTFIAQVPRHYINGVAVIIWFSVTLSLVRIRLGWVFLCIVAVCFILTSLIFTRPRASERPISKVAGMVEYLINNGSLNKKESLAVVSLKSSDTKTPQGDEYRFFLRVEGYDVEEVSDYARADKLIIFVEDENIDWENWNSWETDVFGKKNEPDILQTDGILILIYSK